MPQPELRCCRGSPVSGLRSLHGPRTDQGPQSPPVVDPEVFDPVRAPLCPLAQCQVRRRCSGAQNLEQHSQAFAESLSELDTPLHPWVAPRLGRGRPPARRAPGEGRPWQGLPPPGQGCGLRGMRAGVALGVQPGARGEGGLGAWAAGGPGAEAP